MKKNVYKITLLLCLTSALTLNAQVINAGVGGNNTKNLLARLDTSVLMLHPDLVILMVGTNDLLNSNKMISYQEYEHNLNEIVGKIKKNGSAVVLMSSPPVDSAYLFIRHDRKLFSEAPNIKMDTARHIIIPVSAKNDAKYIDLFQKFTDMNLPKHNEDAYFRNEKNSGKKDGVHFTDLGYQFIAEVVFDYLKTNKLIKKGMKIVCFGDSITRGEGSGKAKSYPTILSNLGDF